MRKALSPSQNVTDEIGKLLRQQYDEVLREPVPDGLLALLDKLETGTTLFREDCNHSVARPLLRRTIC